ncbi:hypothetical protein ACFYUR_27690 [Micromonospora haikouensis]|uniref:hypothetical protein n=1 Tax=Micromonospora TaxID=1873 RepID=UPI001E47BCAA|nr:hypothetical protein [Micromonospora sp. NBRC 110038]
MGMMIVARRVEAPGEKVRYEFGFEDRYDWVLTIDPRTLEVHIEDGDFNPAASDVAAKIVNAWRSVGHFPERMMFAS